MTAPSDAAAERAILGAAILDPDCYLAAADILRASDFYDDRHALVWEAIGDVRAASLPVDTNTVRARLQQVERLARVTDEYLLTLTDAIPSLSGIEARARHLRDMAAARAVLLAARRLISEADEPVESWRDWVDRAELAVSAAAAERASSSEPVPLIQGVDEQFERWSKGQRMAGHACGFKVVDRYLGGFVPGTFVVLAGRPGLGKTAFGLQVARGVAKRSGMGALVQSLEMPLDQITQRYISAEAGVDMQRIRDMRFNREDIESAKAVARGLVDSRVWIDDAPRVTMADFRRNVRKRARSSEGLAIAMLDYLQLVKPTERGRSREEEISAISRECVIIAKEFGVCVLGLSQMNRDADKRGKGARPQLSDLRESGAIEQDAFSVLFIYRDEMNNADSPDKGTAEVIIGKNRNGPTGVVRMAFQKEFTRFGDLAEYGAPS